MVCPENFLSKAGDSAEDSGSSLDEDAQMYVSTTFPFSLYELVMGSNYF